MDEPEGYAAILGYQDEWRKDCEPCAHCGHRCMDLEQGTDEKWHGGSSVHCRLWATCDAAESKSDGWKDYLRTEFGELPDAIREWNAMQREYRCTNELEQWRDIGRRLWPFVRPWGLCGAHPDALKTLEDMANLLGVDTESTNNGNLALLVRQQTLQEVKADFEAKFGRRTLGRLAEEYVKHLEEM